MKLIIEKARPDDREAILEILKFWNMHHIPSVEVQELDLNCFYVARLNDKVAGASGYKILSKDTGKTTLLVIHPDLQGLGIGKTLQDARLKKMHELGVKKVTTNSDRPEIIAWYKKHYGYYEIGKIKKECSFGLETVDEWTTLELNLEEFFKTYELKKARKEEFIAKTTPCPLAPYPPLIINACLTGMIPTKIVTPYVPVSPEEIIENAINVYDAGASIVHIHARDKHGKPTYKAECYEQIISAIRRERSDFVCCVTTSGRNYNEFEKRSEVLHLDGLAKPDMGSLTLGSLNFLTGPSVNSLDMVIQLALMMKEKGIKPELEVFDPGMVNVANYLERYNIISGRKYFNILLGNLNTSSATIGDLASITSILPDNSVYAVAGLGKFQLAMNTVAIATGAHVRVGLEDSIFYDHEQTQLATNEDLIKRIVRISKELQRPIATAAEARTLLEL
jgi:uncharacterized protein (DUF849 family)/N-acetylglutamate synthase-like GNAT family acetyltransferase